MFIQNLKEPFYHTIIDNFYTTDELSKIWQELDLITPNLLSPAETQSYVASALKKGVFLHEVYKRIEFSRIHSMSRKLFTSSLEFSSEQNPFLDYLPHKNADSTLINYYTNKSFYSQHKDDSTLTAVTALWKEPKKFTGGDLRFTKYDYVPQMKNNSTIIFPGFVDHEVTEISMDNTNVGFGRYSITQFITIM
jgi:hypothetical protein